MDMAAILRLMSLAAKLLQPALRVFYLVVIVPTTAGCAIINHQQEPWIITRHSKDAMSYLLHPRS